MTKRTSTRGRSTPLLDQARTIVRIRLEAHQPISPHKLQDEYGISHVTFDMAITAELARREALNEPDIDRALLAMSAQEKLDAATRQYKRRLDLEFEKRVLDEIRRRVTDVILPYYQKEQAQAKAAMNARKGVMDKATFDKIRRCLHPDSRKTASDERLAEAFDAFMALEKKLLTEKDSPTTLIDLPDTYEGWMSIRKHPMRRRAGHSRVARRS